MQTRAINPLEFEEMLDWCLANCRGRKLIAFSGWHTIKSMVEHAERSHMLFHSSLNGSSIGSFTLRFGRQDDAALALLKWG